MRYIRRKKASEEFSGNSEKILPGLTPILPNSSKIELQAEGN